MKLKKEVKRTLFLIVIIIVIVIVIRTIQGIDTTKSDLIKLGYKEDEAIKIMEVLSEEQISFILENGYNEDIYGIISSKYYIPNNYDKYIEYAKDAFEDDEKIISLINTNAYKDFYSEIKYVEGFNINMLMNTYYALPEDYEAPELVEISSMYAYANQYIIKEVNDAYVNMWKAADSEDLTLIVNSSYRTYEDQEAMYQASPSGYAALPGHSEHQTGLALDIVTYGSIENEFENTEEFKWLESNAYKYGFILRYPEGKEDITGYNYESWHYRYLGVELATKVYESGLTYDEYYAYYCEYKNEC